MTSKEYEYTLSIGDTVTVRQWDDMAEEFGVHDSGTYINMSPWFFLLSMKDFCGRDFIIEDIVEGRNPLYKNREFILRKISGDMICYHWSVHMFELPCVNIGLDWDNMILKGID